VLNQKIVSYLSFKGTVAKKVPFQKNNLSKKGNVENDISFPCKETKKVALYINFFSKFRRYFKQWHNNFCLAKKHTQKIITMGFNINICPRLKGQCHEIFEFLVFYQITPSFLKKTITYIILNLYVFTNID